MSKGKDCGSNEADMFPKKQRNEKEALGPGRTEPVPWVGEEFGMKGEGPAIQRLPERGKVWVSLFQAGPCFVFVLFCVCCSG